MIAFLACEHIKMDCTRIRNCKLNNIDILSIYNFASEIIIIILFYKLSISHNTNCNSHYSKWFTLYIFFNNVRNYSKYLTELKINTMMKLYLL